MPLIFSINYKNYYYFFENFKWFSTTLIAPVRNKYLKTNLQAHISSKNTGIFNTISTLLETQSYYNHFYIYFKNQYFFFWSNLS